MGRWIFEKANFGVVWKLEKNNYLRNILIFYKNDFYKKQGWDSADLLNRIEKTLLKIEAEQIWVVLIKITSVCNELCKCAMYHFIFQVFAEQARKSKPDPKIFQQAAFCSKIPNLQPTECLHVGNTVNTDYVGAIGAGWLAKAT